MTAPRTAVGGAGRDREGDRTKQLLSLPPLQRPRGGRAARLPASMSVFPRVPSRLALLGIAQPRSNQTYRAAGALSSASARSCPQPGIHPPRYVLQREGEKKVISATPFPASGFLRKNRREVWRPPAPAPQRPGEEAGAATKTYPHTTLQQDRSRNGVRRSKNSSKKDLRKCLPPPSAPLPVRPLAQAAPWQSRGFLPLGKIPPAPSPLLYYFYTRVFPSWPGKPQPSVKYVFKTLRSEAWKCVSQRLRG